MKLYLALFTLLGFAALTGCSADDLAGPDAVPATTLDQTSEEALHTSRLFLIQGVWQASDRLGSITLLLDEPEPRPTSGLNDSHAIKGKGIVNRSSGALLAVTVEGRYIHLDIAFALLNERGETVAKAQGVFSRDFSRIKVVLLDAAGNERELVFDRH